MLLLWWAASSLASADSGFGRIVSGVLDSLRINLGTGFWDFLFRLAASLPVGAYVFGLIAGTARLPEEKLQAQRDGVNGFLSKLRVVPNGVWVAVTAAFAALFAVRAKMNYTPMYQSRAMFTVSSGYSSDDILSYSYYYDNEAAKQLAAAFPYMLGTDVMNELVRNELGVSYINGSIRAEAVADTNLFVLTVTSSDPQDAYDILEAVIASYPRVALYMVDYSQVIMKSEPTVPTAPYNSFSWKGSAVKGGILGLGLSCLAALVLAMMRKTIFSAADLKASANVPILASVARTSAKKRRSGKGVISLTHAGVDPDFVEAMRGLRIKLLRTMTEPGAQVILVTSTLPGEGKTTISANLALSLASSGLRTVLIDTDLRKQDTKAAVGVNDTRPGLPEYMTDSNIDVASMLSPVPGSSLEVICSAAAKRRPPMNAHKLEQLIERLRPDYDYIVLDTPPCGIISDAKFICRCADAIVYVVRHDYASRNQIVDSMQELADQKAKLTGCVLNDTPAVSHSKRYGYGQYGYGKYGYGKTGYKKYGYGRDKAGD